MERPTDDPLDDPRVLRRADILRNVRDGTIDLEQAAIVLGLSIRQARRLLTAWLEHGPSGLVHGNRGREPVNRTDAELRDRVTGLAAGKYAGANRAHLAELLERHERISIPARTLRRLLDEAGQPSPRPHRAPRHRSRRERAEREGHLLQVDGSRHRWFGPGQPFATLLGAIDDATSRVTGATFRAQEDGAGYFTVLTQTSDRHGLPWLLYSDRHGIFHRDRRRPPTLTEQLTGKRSLTQVGRALEVAGIGWLAAGSPEAKGRVERLWDTLQDRLVIELRLEGITTIEEANLFLPGHLDRHNARFSVPAADPGPAWRPWPDGLSAEAVFAFWYERTVTRDDTLAWGQDALAVPPRAGGRSRAGQKVTLAERLDGSLWAELDGRWEPLVAAPPSASVLRARAGARAPATVDIPAVPVDERTGPDDTPPRRGQDGRAKEPWRPAVDHPWRRGFKRR
jgi:transposase